ncbi:acetamidase/formamidase family protein [Microbacterium sp. CH1]|uniref:acetamidase/formamidase family protein n=1 Tax=Microbacterium sp. CH1 TaxID=1770208 RepID=UPI003FA5B069
MDQAIVCAGTSVLLPVAVEGALLSLGDVHACQGDGELSGIGLEIPATVTIRVTVVPAGAPDWPWIRTDKVVAVMVAAETFEVAASILVQQALALLEESRSLAPAEALALVSVSSDMRIGAAWGGPQVTVRLEIPAQLGVAPEGL